MKLARARYYLLRLDETTTITYVKGEDVHPSHRRLVPAADKGLFNIASTAGAADKAPKATKKTPAAASPAPATARD